MLLQEFFLAHPRVALAFSGGVDSAYLLYAAIQAGSEVRPYFVHSPFQPQFELEDARRLAKQLGVQLCEIEMDTLCDPRIVANDAQRCYYCKRAIFTRLRERAVADGMGVLLDGTNASDQVDDRPGMRALAELDVVSPLRMCGLTKTEIRQRSQEAGLFTHNKPAYACLATRIPTGTAITQEDLGRVEQGEAALTAMGFTDLRLRVMGQAARLELPAEQLLRAVSERDRIRAALSDWFAPVLLNLCSRDE